MVAGTPRAKDPSLRQVLKTRTRDLHERLDASVGSAALGDADNYAAFLAVQYSARAPIEQWAATDLGTDLRPPATSALIADDLAALGCPRPPEQAFTFPAGADPRGLAWALGGSSLGNKAMLVERRRAGHTGADRFLSDPSTAAFFRRLLPHLEQPVSADEADAAVAAAEAVFLTFLAAASHASLKAAA